MSGKKPFKPIEEALDDVADRVAAANNIPTLTPPTRPRPETGPAVTQETRVAFSRAGTRDDVSTGNTPAAAQSSGFTQLRIRCPDPVSDQLVLEQQRLRRQGQRVTLNFLILSALRKAGYRVDDADLIEDGRRLR